MARFLALLIAVFTSHLAHSSLDFQLDGSGGLASQQWPLPTPLNKKETRAAINALNNSVLVNHSQLSPYGKELFAIKSKEFGSVEFLVVNPTTIESEKDLKKVADSTWVSGGGGSGIVCFDSVKDRREAFGQNKEDEYKFIFDRNHQLKSGYESKVTSFEVFETFYLRQKGHENWQPNKGFTNANGYVLNVVNRFAKEKDNPLFAYALARELNLTHPKNWITVTESQFKRPKDFQQRPELEKGSGQQSSTYFPSFKDNALSRPLLSGDIHLRDFPKCQVLPILLRIRNPKTNKTVIFKSKRYFDLLKRFHKGVELERQVGALHLHEAIYQIAKKIRHLDAVPTTRFLSHIISSDFATRWTPAPLLMPNDERVHSFNFGDTITTIKTNDKLLKEWQFLLPQFLGPLNTVERVNPSKDHAQMIAKHRFAREALYMSDIQALLVLSYLTFKEQNVKGWQGVFARVDERRTPLYTFCRDFLPDLNRTYQSQVDIKNRPSKANVLDLPIREQMLWFYFTLSEKSSRACSAL